MTITINLVGVVPESPDALDEELFELQIDAAEQEAASA